jgi:methoxymalonate biosynthesis acyl carrier protein
MMRDDSVREQLEQFLASRLGGRKIAEDDDIFDLGYVNSLFAVQLLRFIEKEFSLNLEPADLEFANFRTVRSITRLVAAKTADVGNASPAGATQP